MIQRVFIVIEVGRDEDHLMQMRTSMSEDINPRMHYRSEKGVNAAVKRLGKRMQEGEMFIGGMWKDGYIHHLTKAERNLMASLLDLAADEYSNHGCNDFNLAEFMPNLEERNEFVRAYHEYNGDPEYYEDPEYYGDPEYYEDADPNDPGDYRLMDFAVMAFLAHKLREDKDA